MLNAFFSGLTLTLSLIVAIGAQNAFVLRQGLQRTHVFAICTVCVLGDITLFGSAVFGFHLIAQSLTWLVPLVRYGGAVFLVLYGANKIRASLMNEYPVDFVTPQGDSLARAVTMCLMFTLFNPHVYLDMLLLGSLSLGFAPYKYAFFLGSTLASSLFFYSLGYGARLLSPLFHSSTSWKILDFAIGVLMCVLAALFVLV